MHDGSQYGTGCRREATFWSGKILTLLYGTKSITSLSGVSPEREERIIHIVPLVQQSARTECAVTVTRGKEEAQKCFPNQTVKNERQLYVK